MTAIQQKGFTLVELMVAITIGMLILSGAISMFITNKRMYTEQDEMGRLQENARFAMNLLIRDIRMAGYTGCAHDIDSITNHVNNSDTDTSLFAFIAVEGAEGAIANWKPSGSTEAFANMLDGSDAITVRYLAPTDIYVMDPAMDAGTATINISSGSDLVMGDIVAITDCDSADIVVLTSDASDPGCVSTATDSCISTFTHSDGSVTGAKPGNWLKALSKTYGTTAKIATYVSRRYYVGTDHVLHRLSGVDADTGVDTVDDIVDGVENMQILYGEDTNGSDQVADTYVDADGVSDWGNVVSARLSLLMRTVEEYGTETDSDTYSLLGATIDPTDDRRRRRIFTSTIQLRNRAN